MDNLMERWHRATVKRVSVRSYEGTPSDEQIAHLNEIAEMLSNDDVSVVITVNGDVFKKGLLGPTKITGTEAFAAIILHSENTFMAGYVGEAFVLECTAMGLGSCWLGASYKKSLAKKLVGLSDNEKLIAAISFGLPMTASEKPRSRKSILKLTGLEETSFNKLPEWQRNAIRCARIAPSAINAQPWEFDVQNDSIQVINTSKNFGYGLVDCGIAMLHIELGAARSGVHGDWTFKNGIPTFISEDDI